MRPHTGSPRLPQPWILAESQKLIGSPELVSEVHPDHPRGVDVGVRNAEAGDVKATGNVFFVGQILAPDTDGPLLGLIRDACIQKLIGLGFNNI